VVHPKEDLLTLPRYLLTLPGRIASVENETKRAEQLGYGERWDSGRKKFEGIWARKR
jgi:hypothetical protein